MPDIWNPGTNSQSEETPSSSHTGNRIPKIPSELDQQKNWGKYSRTWHPCPHKPTASVGKVTATVRAIWHYRALQKMINLVASVDQPLITRASKLNIKLNLTKGAEGDLSWWISLNQSSLMTILNPGNGYQVWCIQPGLGSTSRRSLDKWSSGDDKGIEPHQLSRAASSLTCSPVFCDTEAQHNRTAMIGQQNSSDVHKQVGPQAK